MRPMLASPARESGALPRDSGQWAYEVKWDGMRAIVRVRGPRLELLSRSGRDVAAAFPEFAPGAAGLPDLVLDAEIVVLAQGLPSFGALIERMQVLTEPRASQLAAASPATMMVFDLLGFDDRDLTALPWHQRRALLESLPLPPGWTLSPVYDDVEALLEATVAQGLEGVMAKRRDARYTPGQRSPDWLKLAHQRTQAVLVGGWRPETGSGDRVGALLIGVPDEQGQVQFAGRVGSGIGPVAGVALREAFESLSRPGSPFSDAVPAQDALGARWVEPITVIEVRHAQRTSGGRLRNPVYRGVRSDLSPADVSWEG